MVIGELEKIRNDVTAHHLPEYCHGSYQSISPKDRWYHSLTHSYHLRNGNNPHFPLRWPDDSAARSGHTKIQGGDHHSDEWKATAGSLVSWSKRQNLLVIGIPEGAEGTDAWLFMTTLFREVTGDALLDTSFELDRAHRSLGPKPAQGSQPIVVRFHRHIQKERVLLWVKKTRSISYQGYPIRIFEDFSTSLTKKQASFNKFKSLLYKDGIRFGLIYPARLRVTVAYLTPWMK